MIIHGTDEQKVKLFAALVATQQQLTEVGKGKTAEIKTSKGYTYTYKYADIADILKVCRPVWTSHGLYISQNPTTDMTPSGVIVTVALSILHQGGGYAEVEPLSLATTDIDEKAVGKLITYARRYQLGAVLGIATEDDTDGVPATEPPAHQNGTKPKMINAAQQKALHAAGVNVYGAEAWEQKRHELISKLTKGRTESANDLTAQEASFLIDGINAKADN